MTAPARPRTRRTVRNETRPLPQRPRLSATMPGTTQSISEYIVAQSAAGVHPEHAAGAAGVNPGEFRRWMREGGSVLARVESGADWVREFTPDQQDAAIFAFEMGKAVSTWASRSAVILEQLARGGLTKTTTKRKTRAGEVTEEVTEVETLLPDLKALTWKLERLLPSVYGNRRQVEVSISDLTDEPDVADVLELHMLAVVERLGGTIIDVQETPAAAAAPERLEALHALLDGDGE